MASPPLATVYERHFDELYRYAFSMLRNRVQAEDVVQAVFWIFGKTICSKVFIPHCVLFYSNRFTLNA